MNPSPPTARRVLLCALAALTVGLGAVSLLAGLFGFTRIRHEQPGATVWGPAIEQINA